MKDWLKTAQQRSKQLSEKAASQLVNVNIEKHRETISQVYEKSIRSAKKFAADKERAFNELNGGEYRRHFDDAVLAVRKGTGHANTALTELLETPQMQRVARQFESLSTQAKVSTTKFIESYSQLSSGDQGGSDSLSEEEKLKQSINTLEGKDRIGLLGEGIGAALGAIGGMAAAGSVATAAGASTLLGSTTLGAALGGVFVTTTPVGWVIGSALVLGAAGYGAGKLVRSGSKQDSIRADLIKSLTERLETLKPQNDGETDRLEELKQLGAVCIAGGLIDATQVERVLSLVEAGSLDIEIAAVRFKGLALSAGLIEPCEEARSGTGPLSA